MSLLGVKEFARHLASGASQQVAEATVWTGGIDTLRQIPKLEKLGSRTAVIVGWVPNGVEHRLTSPRGGGQKKAVYALPLLGHATHQDEDQGGDHFDLLLEILRQTYRSAPVGRYVADPLSGAATFIHEIGEEMRLEQREPYMTGKGHIGAVHFFAELVVSCTEILTPA